MNHRGQLMTDLYFPSYLLEFQFGDALKTGQIISFLRPTSTKVPFNIYGAIKH